MHGDKVIHFFSLSLYSTVARLFNYNIDRPQPDQTEFHIFLMLSDGTRGIYSRLIARELNSNALKQPVSKTRMKAIIRRENFSQDIC